MCIRDRLSRTLVNDYFPGILSKISGIGLNGIEKKIRKIHKNGFLAIQTGGNVGTAAWFIAWKILKCDTVGLIGLNHGWDENDDWNEILSHSNAPSDIDRDSLEFKKLYPKVYNPDFDCYCIQDPTYQYYSNATKEFIKRSPEWLTTINATEGG